jgi:hypothetical protein
MVPGNAPCELMISFPEAFEVHVAEHVHDFGEDEDWSEYVLIVLLLAFWNRKLLGKAFLIFGVQYIEGDD